MGWRDIYELVGLWFGVPPRRACLTLTEAPLSVLTLTDAALTRLTLTDSPLTTLTLAEAVCD